MARARLARPGAVCAAVLAAVVVVDQLSKVVVRHTMVPFQSIHLLGRVLRLTYIRNTGAAFGMLPGHAAVFMTVSLVVLFAIGAYWWRSRPTHPVVVTALGLISGGAVGNLVDRAFLGRVTDFIELPCWPVFNLADSAIVVGVGLLVWWLLFGPPYPRTAADEECARPAGADHAAETTPRGEGSPAPMGE